MDQTSLELVRQATRLAREVFAGDASGHDWDHTDRVRHLSLKLAREEGANPLVVELAALLHDVADWKLRDGDLHAGPREAHASLLKWGATEEVAAHVSEIIAGVSFKGAGVETPMRTIEGRCVQDADRLEAIGAIGIARAFAFGGTKGRALYNPQWEPTPHTDFTAYKKNSGPTVNHFYEKLLLLKDRMQTASGAKIAAERHEVLVRFLRQFLGEWHLDQPVPEVFAAPLQ